MLLIEAVGQAADDKHRSLIQVQSDFDAAHQTLATITQERDGLAEEVRSVGQTAEAKHHIACQNQVRTS